MPQRQRNYDAMGLRWDLLENAAELIRREEQELSISGVDGRIVGFSDFERNLHSVLQWVNLDPRLRVGRVNERGTSSQIFWDSGDPNE